jgi:RNA:NAD 2'-phosphotransferase (TPT1/KptA family)
MFDDCRDGKCPVPDGDYQTTVKRASGALKWGHSARVEVLLDVDGKDVKIVKTEGTEQGIWDTLLALGLRPSKERAEMQKAFNALPRTKGRPVTLTVRNGKGFVNAARKS